MKLLVDADSCSAAARAIIQKRAAKENIPLHFAANRPIPFDLPYHPLVETGIFVMEVCPVEKDAADNRLVALAQEGDVAVTRDIPLAARLVKKNVHTLDDRGRIFTQENIRHCLSLRNFNIAIAGNGRPERAASYGGKEKKTFADSLDRIITAATSRESSRAQSDVKS
ncbi:MAG: DUF188 domain-containing protein [Spirochaetaceae bacterium]|nr:DUF188 domain-containing protein [Spirochaetaceae bacterium]